MPAVPEDSLSANAPTAPLPERSARERADEPRFALVIVRDGETSKYALPDEGPVVSGRRPSAGIRVDGATVSREHVALYVGQELRVEDLGSANGTRVRDQPLAPNEPVEVFPDDVIDLGAVLLVVQYRSLRQR